MLSASSAGHTSIANFLLDEGRVPVNFTNRNGETPLMLAARSGNESLVRSLLRRGADVNRLNKSGISAFFFAAMGSISPAALPYDPLDDSNRPSFNSAFAIILLLVEHGAEMMFSSEDVS